MLMFNNEIFTHHRTCKNVTVSFDSICISIQWPNEYVLVLSYGDKTFPKFRISRLKIKGYE